MNLLILFLVFGTTTLAGSSIVLLITRRRRLQNRFQEVLEGSASTARNGEGALSSLVMKWLQEASRVQDRGKSLQEEWEKSHLRSKLVTAGFRQDVAPVVFQGTKVVLAALTPMAYLLSRLIVGTPMNKMILIAVGSAAVGFYLPSIYLRNRIKNRQRRLSKALPNALDMMVISVEAGLGLDAALQRVGEEMGLASPDLAEELRLTSLELRAGKSRMEAFKNIGIRTGVDEIQALAALLIQTDRFGTSIADAIRVHAGGMRTKRRQQLEEEAAKTSVKLLFPLIFFIFPAILVVMVGPAILQIARVLMPAMSK